MADNTSKVQHITALDFDITSAVSQLEELHQKVETITQQITGTNWSINAVINGSGEYAELNSQLQAANQQIEELQESLVNMSQVGINHTSLLASAIESKLVGALKNASAAAYEATKDTEDSMVEISRVLNLTASETEKLRNSLFNLGKEYGRSFADTADIALRYAQAGNDMNDTLSLTNDFLLALNTAELDVENGVQSLIGIMNQWGMSASDLSTVIDKLNYTADNNAVTTQDLVDGLLKASSMAKTAGMSFDDTVGSLTAMKVASGAAGKEVGNAFKSIMAYIQRPDSLKTFDSMGIDVFKDKATGELLPMMEILQNMSKKWNTSQEEMLNTLIESGDALQMMSEEWAIATDSMEEYTEYQEAVTEATDKANDAESRAQAQAAAGVFRRNYYISLMENFNKAMEISADLVNSEGHSMAENSRYMETLTAKTEQLQTALVELAVTAADAGLLDFAKDCLDAAASVTQWVTNTKTLIPLLIALSGVMLTLKQDKIANEISAVWKSFKNGINTIGTLINRMTGAAAATNAAGTAAQGAALSFDSLLGAAGLIITAIGLVTAAIQKNHAEFEQMRQDTIEQAKTDKQNYDNLNDLIKKYEEYAHKLEYTKEDKENLRTLSEDLVDMYGSEAASIDLVNGKYDEQIKNLQDLNQKKLENLEISQQSALTFAEDETQEFIRKAYESDRIKTEKNKASLKELKSIVDETINETMTNPIAFEVGVFGGIKGISVQQDEQGLEALSDAMERLRDKGHANSETFALLGKAYTELSEKLNGVRQAADELADTELALYIKEEGKAIEDLTLKSFPEWEKGLLALAEDDEYLRESLQNTADGIKNDLLTADISSIIDSGKYEELIGKLKGLSESGKLNVNTFTNAASAYKEFNTELEKLGISEKDFVNTLSKMHPELNTTAESTETLSDNLDDINEQLQSFADTISSSENSISSLNKYIETLNNGSGLTAQQVMELCDTYGLLAEQFTLTENGYKIEVSALETLRNAQIETAVSARKSQAEYTNLTTQKVMERIQAYGLEIQSITSIAEAEAALLALKAERNNITSSIGSAYEANYYSSQISDIDSIIGSINDLKDEYSNIEAAADDFYKNLGKSFESVSTSAGKAKDTTEETVDTFKVLTEGFEHLVSLGAYSVDEQIAYYEKLRRELDLTEEQYRSLESTLHKLYRSQVDEQVEAVKEAYEQQKQAVEDYYDGEKEALEKALEEEKSAREEYWDDEINKLKDNLNSQISAAKTAYEEKKKLADKSYDNQIKALESLRDNELDNIKAVYDAQISALEKIKAARNSERNEEDYQDERAELLEQISYWEQRTSTEAVENIANLKKQLADLDKNRSREREDEETDAQISSLKEQRDGETAEAEKYYNAQIAALKSAQDTELEMYETTYNREIELLEKRLETEVKALEKKRDNDLALLDEQQEKKLADLDAAKEAAINAEEEKWEAIQAMFTEQNLDLIASAGEFAPELYDKFNKLFTKKFEMDLEKLAKAIKELDKAKSKIESGASGLRPSYSAPSSVGKAPTVPSSVSSSNNSSSQWYPINTKVKVSGTVYGDSYGNKPGKKLNGIISNITGLNRNGTKPYHVGSLGWVDKSQLVKARTGGKTKADGIAMLHKDELIINPPTTKKLEELMKELRPKPTEADIKAKQDAVLANWCREIGKTQRAMIQAVQNHNNTYNTSNTNNVSNSYRDENSRQIIQNFNAPLQNIEKVEDGADINAAVNAMEREIMRKMAGML